MKAVESQKEIPIISSDLSQFVLNLLTDYHKKRIAMNSLKSSIGKWIAVYALIFFASSCKKLEFDKIAQTAWNPNLAIPLAYADFGVYDILARQDSTDLVVIDPSTGAIALVYKGEIAS